jgi:hypothetical protein
MATDLSAIDAALALFLLPTAAALKAPSTSASQRRRPFWRTARAAPLTFESELDASLITMRQNLRNDPPLPGFLPFIKGTRSAVAWFQRLYQEAAGKSCLDLL